MDVIKTHDIKIKHTESEVLNKHYQDDAIEIINYWNSKTGLTKCRGSERQIESIRRKINKYNIDDLKTYIDRYYMIYSDETYFFNYKWNLELFVNHKDTISRFDDEGSIWISYIDRKEKPKLKIESEPNIEPVFEFVEGYDDVLKTLKNMDYTKYLLTEHWKHFSKQARSFYHNKCQLCDASHVPLHVHHKTYTNRGRETFADVIVLCDKCHKHTHSMPKE